MSRILPILFNTNMVRAILDGSKTVTRRCVKYKYSNTEMKMRTDKYGTRLIEIQKDVEGETFGKNPDGSTWRKLRGYIEKKPSYQPGDILYVRETWNWNPLHEYGTEQNKYIYKAGYDGHAGEVGWHSSIHMPKEAARIWLKVTDVRVERLLDITDKEAEREGAQSQNPFDYDVNKWPNKEHFKELWNSTIKKSDLDRYGWNANPYVWVIEFERCEKPDIQLKSKSKRTNENIKMNKWLKGLRMPESEG